MRVRERALGHYTGRERERNRKEQGVQVREKKKKRRRENPAREKKKVSLVYILKPKDDDLAESHSRRKTKHDSKTLPPLRVL